MRGWVRLLRVARGAKGEKKADVPTSPCVLNVFKDRTDPVN